MKDLHELNIINFPDGHKHLKLDEKDLELEEISISIKSFDDLFVLTQLRNLKSIEKLRINYLLGARCDRQFSQNEAIDLEIIAKFINDLFIPNIEILKPHSKKSLELIANSKEITVTDQLLQQCIIDNNLVNYSIISPDKGASQWITKELGKGGVVQCNKIREEGIVKSVTFTDEIKEICIIIDDLCDGGATFLELSRELRVRGAKKVYLCITHGIFSKGFEVFSGLINHIYCTNSFNNFKHEILTQIKVC